MSTEEATGTTRHLYRKDATGTSFVMSCRCGREVEFDRTVSTIDCECGGVYAVTITVLDDPAE